jgi:hypothetical protein
MAAYVPMMMRPGWFLERYLGWSLLHESDSAKLLGRRRGPVRTFLLLARGAAVEELRTLTRGHGLVGPTSIAVFNDFLDGGQSSTREIAGARFARVERDRWFGEGTFVIDLGEDTPVLFSRLPSRERTKCRAAEGAGVRVEIEDPPTRAGVDAFLTLYRRLARDKGLEQPSPAVLERMGRQGDLLLSRGVDGGGRTLVANLTYRQGGSAYFLHGARAAAVTGGAGHLTQWKTIERLKSLGLRFYDLGLAGSRDPSDGIYRFKRSLGGTFVDFGSEFRRVPSGLAAAYGAFRSIRGMLRRW